MIVAFNSYFLNPGQLCNKLDGGGWRHNDGGNIEKNILKFKKKPGIQTVGVLGLGCWILVKILNKKKVPSNPCFSPHQPS